MTGNNKIFRAVITSVVFVVVYFGFLYLPANVFKIALSFSVLGFLASLYFDPDYRFFKVALLLIGVFSINITIPTFNFLVESDNYYLNILKQEESFSVKNLSLFFGGLFCLLLDFLREDGGSRQLISVIGIGNTVSNTIHNHNLIDTKELAKVLAKEMVNEDEIEKNEYVTSLEKTIEDLKDNKQDEALSLLEKGKVEEAEKLLIQYANVHSKKSSQAWLNIGNIAYLYNTSKALNAYKKAIEIDQNNIDAQNNLSLIYLRLGQLKDAEKVCKKVLILAGDNLWYQAAAYGNMGNICNARTDFDKALILHEKSLEKSKQLKHLEGMADSYGNIATIYAKTDDFVNAQTFFKKNLEIEELIGRKKGIALNHNNIGNILHRHGDLDEALKMYQKSLSLNKSLDDREGMALNYSNMGVVYETAENFEEALAMYDKSLSIDEALGHIEGTAITNYNIGGLYQNLGKLSEALSFYKKSKLSFELIGAMNNIELVDSRIKAIKENHK